MVCNASRWYIRMPVKWLVFLVVTFLVLFPNPIQFARHVSHVSDLDAMANPESRGLDAWEEEFRERLGTPPVEGDIAAARETERRNVHSPRAVQEAVQAFVYEKVKYRWDWEVWGAADYMPTVEEMFELAAGNDAGEVHEDCDGRAVMAASLMRRLGYEAHIVTDLRHVWVTTPQGEWMGPGGRKTVVSSPQGNRLDLRTAWSNVPISLSFGVSVFPLSRELVILAAAYVLMLHRSIPRRQAALAGLLLVQGLLFLRCGVLSPQSVSQFNASWPALVGMLHVVTGLLILAWEGRRARRTISAAGEKRQR